MAHAQASIQVTVGWYTGKLLDGSECVICEVDDDVYAVSIEASRIPDGLREVGRDEVTMTRRVQSVKLVPGDGEVTLYIDGVPYRTWYSPRASKQQTVYESDPDADLRAGRYEDFESMDAFLDTLPPTPANENVLSG